MIIVPHVRFAASFLNGEARTDVRACGCALVRRLQPARTERAGAGIRTRKSTKGTNKVVLVLPETIAEQSFERRACVFA